MIEHAYWQSWSIYIELQVPTYASKASWSQPHLTHHYLASDQTVKFRIPSTARAYSFPAEFIPRRFHGSSGRDNFRFERTYYFMWRYANADSLFSSLFRRQHSDKPVFHVNFTAFQGLNASISFAVRIHTFLLARCLYQCFSLAFLCERQSSSIWRAGSRRRSERKEKHHSVMNVTTHSKLNAFWSTVSASCLTADTRFYSPFAKSIVASRIPQRPHQNAETFVSLKCANPLLWRSCVEPIVRCHGTDTK